MFFAGNLVILNLFLALLLSSFSDMGGGDEEDDEPDKMAIAAERVRRFKRWLVGGIKYIICCGCCKREPQYDQER